MTTSIAHNYQKDVLQRAVDAVDAHDKETRRMLDEERGKHPAGTFPDRSVMRERLVEAVLVAARSLLAVLP